MVTKLEIAMFRSLAYINVVFHIVKTIYVLNDDVIASFTFDIAIVVF